ncbi:MAG: two pore domain potassium channel family protein [Candidatus Microthrix parvicella]|uniref:Potassium channel domain-containing protein n=1 Tax=Candidatus Neomicrothrix parvicella RN1 TaxID=1229780 RepID=R4Z6D0_9ACTN|nr:MULTISPECIES: potassium channel family protein [Microthrix]MBK7021855.1 two pore domain potassium channel family protein [Candidatus Microthrix sp.]NLH66482.1 two pore domain potassium channel family protein [Candidatus Microthrix parvicella]CCM64427.1 putative Predicted protein [Candidatus Microthrix parvicella RN1]
MSDPTPSTLSRRTRRRLIILGLLRACSSTVVLLALYFVVPLDRSDAIPIGASLALALVVLLGVAVWQMKATIRSSHPPIRAVEALGVTVPLFLLLFATSYFLMAQSNPANFSAGLTRIDALYFTITAFSSTGFGDITATSQSARLLVSVQMILDLLVLGLGVKAFVGAVQLGRQHHSSSTDTPTDT